MEQQNIFLILKVLKENKKVNILLHEGVSYKRIGELTEFAIEKKLIQVDNNEFKLTEEGEAQYKDLENIYKKTKKDEWITKEIDSQIPKLNPDFIYLPDQTEIDF